KRSGVGPPAVDDVKREIAPLAVRVVDVRDLKLTARARNKTAAQLEDGLVVHVHARHAVVTLRPLGFLLDAHDAAIVQDRHAETLRIRYFLEQQTSTRRLLLEGSDVRRNVFFQDVVTEDHHDTLASGKMLREFERIGDAGVALLIRI